jgi:L-fuconolactonase
LTDRVIERIDAHQHVWDLAALPQPWIADPAVLNRTFTLAEREPHVTASGVDRTVPVETINLAPDTAELLALAATHQTIRGVVGWYRLS